MKPDKRYPKTVKIKKTEYRIKFVDDLDGASGLCDSGDAVITISRRQSAANIHRSLIHEIFHAMESEYDIKLSHKSVYKLERAIYQFIKDNL